MTSSNHVVVRLRPGSDGDATHVPPSDGRHTLVNPPLLYLEKTAQQWMVRRGDARPGVKYVLEGLPAGYSMWQRPRSDAKFTDKYLYGHPGKKKFDSPNRFYPHFEHLMDNGGSSIGCQCKVCAGSAGILPSHSPTGNRMDTINQVSASRPPTPKYSGQVKLPSRVPAVQAKGRPKHLSAGMDTSRIDEEGTPDVYRNLIDNLRHHNTIDEVIQEPFSLDWRAENEILPKLLQSLAEHEQWIPRNGEIILFIRELPEDVEILRQDVSNRFLLYKPRTEEYLGNPQWEAGLVGQVPTKTTTIEELIQDKIGKENTRNTNVIYSGVRVEPLPNPNELNKSLSKQYKYVMPRQTRPYILWKDLLHGIPQEVWHPTILNALTVASTISLMGKYRFRGTWPTANIYCHAMYLGPEMLAVGDTVRLSPTTKSGQTTCSDIMVIKSFRLKWSNLDKASNNDYDEGRPYNSEIWIYGSAYTSDPVRSNKQWLSERNVDPPKAAAEYCQWYPLHPSCKELAVPHTRVLSRLYEQEAMSFFLDPEYEDLPDLDIGHEAIVEARAFSRQHDQRIAQDHAAWYWGDDRADALNIKTINGLEISKFDPERDVKDWRKKIKLIEGITTNNTGTNSEPQTTAVGPGSRDLRSFMAPEFLPVFTRMHDIGGASSSRSSSGTSHNRQRVNTGQKRNLIVNLSDDDDDEDEIRQHTKVVENTPGTTEKRAKVMVVID